MSKGIILSMPCYGHVNVTVGLARELIKRGDNIIYYSDEAFKKVVAPSGVQFRSYGKSIDEFESKETKLDWTDRLSEVIQRLSYTIEWNSYIFDTVFQDIKSEEPDYIMYDTFCMSGKKIANLLEVPAITSVPIFVYNNAIANADPDNFIRNMLRMEDDSLFTEENMKQKKMSKLFNIISTIVSKKYNLKNTDIMEVFNCYSGLNIVFTSKMFQPYAEVLDECFQFVGCSIGERDQVVEFPWHLLDERPLVYISLGTTYVNELLQFYKQCIEAFTNKNMQVVMTIGKKITQEMLGYIPPNFIVRDYVPQLEILKKADVFLTHGGANSANEAFYFNVPIVLYPQSGDQFDVANRVEQLGAGIVIDAKNLSPAGLYGVFERVIQDKVIKKNCIDIGSSLRSAGGCKKATDEICSYVMNYKK